MKPKPSPQGKVADIALPCFVCGSATVHRRSISQNEGPPLTKEDETPVCLGCNEAWTSSIHQTCGG